MPVMSIAIRKVWQTFCVSRNIALRSATRRTYSTTEADDSEGDDYNTESSQSKQYSTYESFKSSLANKSLADLLNQSTISKQNADSTDVAWSEWSEQIARRDQSRRGERPKTAPEDTTVILFPGQGSQYVGMAELVVDTPNVLDMFAIAKKILGYDLLNLCLNGPKEHLDKTQFCQPAIYVSSLAAIERLRQMRDGEVEACVATAGFSVGEITALAFAGAITFEDGLRLVKIRAEAMQYASELVPSGMMTVFFNADAKISFACRAAREWCVRNGIDEDIAVCQVANYLFPHCKVIAGHAEALQFLQTNAKDFGIKRIKRLPVSGAFHTKLMSPAKQVLKAALKHIKIEVPLIPVHCNYDARIYRDPQSIREKLAKQITSPVLWEQILHTIYERPREMKCPKTYECGPGSTLLSILNMVHGVARRSATHVPV